MNTYIQCVEPTDAMLSRLKDQDLGTFHEIWMTTEEPTPPHHPHKDACLCLWRYPRSLAGELIATPHADAHHHESHDRHSYLWIKVNDLGAHQQDYLIECIKARLAAQKLPVADADFRPLRATATAV